MHEGARVNFLVRSDAEGVLRAHLDACYGCYQYKMGYLVEGTSLVCRACRLEYPIGDATWDFIGACAPIALNATVEGDEVPKFMGAKKMSLHQTGFQEVLAMAELLGDYPQHILLVGVQPAELEDYGGSLRPSVRAQIGPAIAAALRWLEARGIDYQRRTTPLPQEAGLHPQQLNLAAYEAYRPNAAEACRAGDERVLRDTSVTFDPKPVDLGDHRMSVNVDSRRKD